MGRSNTLYKRQDGHRSNMLDTLSTYLRRILGFPMADNNLTLSTLLLTPTGSIIPVEDLEVKLKQAYTYAVYHDQLNPDRARVCHLQFMKERDGLQHEYIFAYVTVDGKPWAERDTVRLGVIQCERNVDREHDSTANHIVVASSNANSSGAFKMPSTASFSDGWRIPAADRLIIFNPSDVAALQERTDVCLYEYPFRLSTIPPKYLLDPTGISASDFQPPPTCPPRSRGDTSPPSLYDLAAAAIALKLTAPDYIIWRNQCYWFAAVLYYTLGGESAAGYKTKNNIPNGLVAATPSPAAGSASLLAPAMAASSSPEVGLPGDELVCQATDASGCVPGDSSHIGSMEVDDPNDTINIAKGDNTNTLPFTCPSGGQVRCEANFNDNYDGPGYSLRVF
ncbi:hypothetical protein NUW54_g2335 [Trametes sanguinea]|uniref:Uncharacterized protein n=1 Tax=Trametes sanguinea TaxID=158606 RepID=A0ACC1Q3V6_9APHY|nr:hypothetical protein NUW54_g2335 [Trametes sanguinea]